MSSSADQTQTVPVDQLADRFKKLSAKNKDTNDEQELEKVQRMTLEELSRECINFGKTYVGRPFPSMMDNTRYVTWFVSNYKHSRQPHHAKFIRYIQLYVADMEKNPLQAQSKAAPKSKTKSGSQIQSGLLCGEGHGATNTSRVERGGIRPDGSIALGKLGGSGSLPNSPQGGGDSEHARAPVQDGGGDAASSSSSESAIPADTRKVNSGPSLDPDFWSEIASFVSPMPSCELDEQGFIDNGEFVYVSSNENWVANEMWNYMKSKGLSPKEINRVKSDLVEIYCSSESELTKCAQREGSIDL